MDLVTLATLPDELRQSITVRELQPGQVLFHQGDPAVAFFFVQSGRIKLLHSIDRQETVTFQVAGTGDSIAEIALFTDTYPDTAIADIRSQVIVYPKRLLSAALHDYPELAEDFMMRLVQKIQSLQQQLGLRNIRAAHDRVLRYLRYLAQREDQTVVRFDRPLKDIATELGLTPETLSRALARLEQEGTISRQNQVITLHNSTAA
jgi:CRP/FNR family transcriptional regulator, dissimilatory nitrate respiration regulator